ncbi:beta-glucosidase [Fusarium napiforme]|uniref:beta-glucosidase n=1 Tax=Fusarium napiforme TaxID=42672 RepID=A0A8H5MNN4_9HYPO|nr:beta-glucosidase [Fusarium napiforme]
MPWINNASAVCHAWYGGNETGNAIADVLFGDVNPGGKLPLTIPARLQDNPTFFNHRSEAGRVLYGEDIYVGYRYYEKIDSKPLFPFGHGLSYSKFALKDLSVQVGATSTVTVQLSNTGLRSGSEVVQVYVALQRPVKELKAFRKVHLEAGESKQVIIDLDTVLSTSYWDEARDKWCSQAGGGIHWTNTVLAPDPTARCDNCQKSNSQCTFQMPSKARGPKRKTGYRYRYSIGTAHSASASPELNASDTVNASSPLSPLPFSKPGSYVLEELAPEPSIATNASPAGCTLPYPTDVLLPRDLIHFILNDYLVHVYPLIPVIHRPSFKIDLERNNDLHDESFLILIVSLCALTVSILPSRLQIYQDFSSPLPFRTRTEMVNHCHKFCQSFRDASYFDTVSHDNWASSFLLGIAFHQAGNTNQWRMLEVEAMQLLRLLEVHRVLSYAGLDAIEIQLRKKAFWLMFYGYVHQMHNLRNERLMFLDTMLSCELNLEDLMPASVDDEYISSSGQLPCPEDIAAASLTVGYNIHSRIFAAALRPPGSIGKQTCICSHLKDPQQRLVSLRERLHHLKYMLDTVPAAYGIWNKKTSAPTVPTSAATTSSTEGEEVGNIQREAIRVNIHVTHLWLQREQIPGQISLQDQQRIQQQRMHATAMAQQQATIRQQTAQQMGAGSQKTGYQQMGMCQPYSDIPATDPSDIHILTGRGFYVTDFLIFLCACREGDLSTLESIVASQTRSPLFLHHGLLDAIKHGKVEIVRYLLQSGTPISRNTPETILRAPADQQVALLQLFTEHGWAVNSPERLLPRLIQTNNEPLLDWFLEHGADPNIGGSDGDPDQALRLAASQGTVRLVQKLLDGGAKMTSNGLGLFYAAGACPVGSIPHAGLVQPSAEFDKSRIPVMALLVENGAGVNDKLETQHVTAQYPIVNAVMAGAVERVKWLLSQGADPDLKGQYGSARDYAKFRSSDEMKQVLGVSDT